MNSLIENRIVLWLHRLVVDGRDHIARRDLRILIELLISNAVFGIDPRQVGHRAHAHDQKIALIPAPRLDVKGDEFWIGLLALHQHFDRLIRFYQRGIELKLGEIVLPISIEIADAIADLQAGLLRGRIGRHPAHHRRRDVEAHQKDDHEKKSPPG